MELCKGRGQKVDGVLVRSIYVVVYNYGTMSAICREQPAAIIIIIWPHHNVHGPRHKIGMPI